VGKGRNPIGGTRGFVILKIPSSFDIPSFVIAGGQKLEKEQNKVVQHIYAS
jgi:hypothetical protein